MMNFKRLWIVGTGCLFWLLSCSPVENTDSNSTDYTGTINGTVYNKDTLVIIPGASIQLSSGYSATSGADGKFSFEKIKAGYTIMTVTALYYSNFTTNVVVEKTFPLTIQLFLSPSNQISNTNTGIITGTVKDITTSNVISGVSVSISGLASTTSGGDGSYVLSNIPAGGHTLSAIASGYSNYSQSVSLTVGQILTNPVYLSPMAYSLKVATYNVEDFVSNTYSIAADLIKNENIDVIVFEEIQTDDATSLNTALSTAGVTWMTNTIYSASGGGGDDYIACWSKYPLDQAASLYYDMDYLDPLGGTNVSLYGLRPVLRFRCQVGPHYVWFYGAHLKAFEGDTEWAKRRTQANAIEDDVLTNRYPLTEYIVILGDMNTVQTDDFTNTINYLQLKSDGNSANDFTAMNYTLLPSTQTHNDGGILDHIFLSPTASAHYVSNSITISTGTVNPDHRAVILQFDLE